MADRDTSHPAMKLKQRGSKWMQKATRGMKQRGTEGSLTRIAQAHGESPMEFAREHYHSPGKVGEKARFAVNANKGK